MWKFPFRVLHHQFFSVSRKSSFHSSDFPSNFFCYMYLLDVRWFSRSNLNISFSQNLSSLALKEFTFSQSITSSGSSFHSLTILSVKKLFLSFPLLFRVDNFFECPLVRVLVSLWRRAPEILWSSSPIR